MGRRLFAYVVICCVGMWGSAMVASAASQVGAGRDVPEGVRDSVPSLVRVIWECADETRLERVGFVEGRGFVAAGLPENPISAVVVGLDGVERPVVGVAASTGLAGSRSAYGMQGLLDVEWEGDHPPGLDVIDKMPEFGSVSYLVRPGGMGGEPWIKPLQLASSNDYLIFTASWADLVRAEEIANCIVVTARGAVVGLPRGTQYLLASLPPEPAVLAKVGLHGAGVLVDVMSRDLPVEKRTWDEHVAFRGDAGELDGALDGLKVLAETDAEAAVLRAREIVLRHPDHPAAWVVLYELTREVGDESAAVLALERAVAYDPHDIRLTLRLCRAYVARDPVDHAGLRRIARTGLRDWSDVSAGANWFLCVDAWYSGSLESAEAFLDKAIRLAPGHSHYRKERHRLFGRVN